MAQKISMYEIISKNIKRNKIVPSRQDGTVSNDLIPDSELSTSKPREWLFSDRETVYESCKLFNQRLKIIRNANFFMGLILCKISLKPRSRK